MEDATASHRLDGVEFNLSAVVPLEVPSPEDIAWADSCLVNDLGISKTGWDSWNSLSNALNEVTSSKPDIAPARWGDISYLSKELSSSQILDSTVDGIFMPEEEATDKITEDTDLASSRFNLRNVFRPTYSEDLRDGGSNDSEESKVLGFWEEESLEDIFKVWNLETPTEDDEFIKQLNKAFSESSLVRSSPNGLENESIDDVICGMADLSLHSVTL